MNKEDIIKIMLDSINADNREMCKQMGMSADDTEKQIQQSQQSLIFMFGNIYDKLKEVGAIA